MATSNETYVAAQKVVAALNAGDYDTVTETLGAFVGADRTAVFNKANGMISDADSAAILKTLYDTLGGEGGEVIEIHDTWIPPLPPAVAVAIKRPTQKLLFAVAAGGLGLGFFANALKRRGVF